MKAGELKEMTNEELLHKEGELKNELFNLRFQAASGQIENPMRIRAVRKEIARIKTILREKELESQRGNVE
jgi:large subunit ribosomal protein L29